MAPCGHLEARPPHLVFSFLLVLSSLFYEFPVAPGTSSRLSLIISACLRTRAGVEQERFSVLLIIRARGVLARLDSRVRVNMATLGIRVNMTAQNLIANMTQN